jgi:hypothetical protein
MGAFWNMRKNTDCLHPDEPKTAQERGFRHSDDKQSLKKCTSTCMQPGDTEGSPNPSGYLIKSAWAFAVVLMALFPFDYPQLRDPLMLNADC